MEQKWATLHFGEVKVETDEKQHLFKVQVYSIELDPIDGTVELFAERIK